VLTVSGHKQDSDTTHTVLLDKLIIS